MNNLREQRKKVYQTSLDAIPLEFNDSMVEEMSEKEFRMYIMKMIREVNNEMKEQMQALNDRTNHQLKKQMQEAKDHFNKERF